MRELPSSIRVLMNLYEVGLQGYCRTSSYVVSTGGYHPLSVRENRETLLLLSKMRPQRLRKNCINFGRRKDSDD